MFYGCFLKTSTYITYILQKLKKLFKQKTIKNFAIVGGASANLYLRKELENICLEYKSTLHLSDLMYCSDNAAMIGRVAVEQYKQNDFINLEDLDIKSRLKDY